MADMLAHHDLRALAWHSPAEIHLLAEVMRRAFAVRNHFLGDPDKIVDPDGTPVVAAIRRLAWPRPFAPTA